MVSITPCQRIISDRFPVASFVVNAPPQRLFEIACATDAALFRPDQRHRRTAENFFSTRLGGLMRAPAGRATYLMPSEQLRRFAGAGRLFYNVASYANARGDDPRFGVPPDATPSIPSVQISQDFTGKTLDRSRLGGQAARADARYGAAAPRPEELSWGGDLAAAAGTPATGTAVPTPYDDGYSPDLWRNQPPEPPALGGARAAAAAAPAEDGGADDASDADATLEEPAGYEDAPDVMAHGGAIAPAAPPPPPTQARYGGYAADEPPGAEDGAELNRRARRALPAAPRASKARLGGAATADLAGFEDAPALARSRARRYGAVAYAEDTDGAPGPAAAAPPTPAPAPAPATPAAAAPAATAAVPTGRDDDYDDGSDEIEEPEPPADLPAGEARAQAAPVPLTIPEKFKLITLVARNEGGAGREAYSAVNPDGEYDDPSHAFYRRRHVGLSWGIVQATELSGALGRVLAACKRRDAATFTRVFGADGDELLRVTNADTEGDRLDPVGPCFLWEGDWPDRFRNAGRIPAFQAAQNEVAIEGYLDPNLPFARFLGWDTDRALAMLYDRCVHMGNVGGRSFIIRAVNPIRTQRQRADALAALGFPDLQAFADGVPELGGDGRWTPMSHAALAGALRALGGESPVPLPSLSEQLDRVLKAAEGRRFAERLRELRSSPELYDVTYQLLG
jgi:hypothetical protein